jgi:hypothetical protein
MHLVWITLSLSVFVATACADVCMHPQRRKHGYHRWPADPCPDVGASVHGLQLMTYAYSSGGHKQLDNLVKSMLLHSAPDGMVLNVVVPDNIEKQLCSRLQHLNSQCQCRLQLRYMRVSSFSAESLDSGLFLLTAISAIKAMKLMVFAPDSILLTQLSHIETGFQYFGFYTVFGLVPHQQARQRWRTEFPRPQGVHTDVMLLNMTRWHSLQMLNVILDSAYCPFMHLQLDLHGMLNAFLAMHPEYLANLPCNLNLQTAAEFMHLTCPLATTSWTDSPFATGTVIGRNLSSSVSEATARSIVDAYEQYSLTSGNSTMWFNASDWHTAGPLTVQACQI